MVLPARLAGNPDDPLDDPLEGWLDDPAGWPAMSAVELVDALIDAHNTGDAEALASWYAPGATVRMDGWPEPVDARTWIAAFDMRDSFPDVTLSRGPVAAGPGVVIAEVRIRGTNTGPLTLGQTDRLILSTDADRLPPTGRLMDIVGTVVLEVSEAKVTAERHYWPALDGLVQLGLLTLDDPVTT